MSRTHTLELLLVSCQPALFNQTCSELRANGYELHFTSISRQSELSKALCSDLSYDAILYCPNSCSISNNQFLDALSRFAHTPPTIKLVHKASETDQHQLFTTEFSAVLAEEDRTLLCQLLPQLIDQYRLQKENRALSFQLNELQRRHERLFMQSSSPQAYLADGIYQACNSAYLDFFQLPSAEGLLHTSILDHIEKNFRKKAHSLLSTPLSRCVTLDLAFISQYCDLEKTSVTFQPEYFQTQECLHLIIKPNSESAQHSREVTKVEPQSLLAQIDDRQTFINRIESTIHSNNSKALFNILIIVQTSERIESQRADDPASTNQLLSNLDELLQASTKNPFTIGRLGQFEFGLLVYESSVDRTFTLAESIKRKINTPFSTASIGSLEPQCSLGLASITDSTLDAEEIVSHARNNILSSRSQNVDSVCLNRRGSQQGNLELLAEHIENAVEKSTFRILFQPIIAFKQDQKETYEVLTRLLDPDGNDILPESFLPTVNLQRIGEKLDRAVILKIVQDSASSQHSNGVMLINLTPDSIYSKTFLPWLREVLAESLTDSSHVVVLQINEIVFFHRLEDSLIFCKNLKEMGIRVALTHFGCTLEPFKYLQQIDPFYVALDDSLVKKISYSHQHFISFSNIIMELHSQNYKVAVRNIEDMDTLPLLWKSGIDLAQGFCLQKPCEEMNYNFIHEQEITLGARPGSFV